MINKNDLLKYWAGELLAVKMELEKISFILEAGCKPPKEIEKHLDNMLDRKKLLEKLIEEVKNSN